MEPKKIAWIAGTAVAALLAVFLVVDLSRLFGTKLADSHTDPWNAQAIVSTFSGVKVSQIDSSTAALTFSYDLDNTTDDDFQLTKGPSVVIMSHLKSDGTSELRATGLAQLVHFHSRQKSHALRLADQPSFQLARPRRSRRGRQTPGTRVRRPWRPRWFRRIRPGHPLSDQSPRRLAQPRRGLSGARSLISALPSSALLRLLRCLLVVFSFLTQAGSRA